MAFAEGTGLGRGRHAFMAASPVGVGSDGVEAVFEGAPRGLARVFVGIAGDADRLAVYHHTAGER